MKTNTSNGSDFTQRDTMPSFNRSSSVVETLEQHMILKPKIENDQQRPKRVESKQQIRFDTVYGECNENHRLQPREKESS
jgi:hypothetical protein